MVLITASHAANHFSKEVIEAIKQMLGSTSDDEGGTERDLKLTWCPVENLLPTPSF